MQKLLDLARATGHACPPINIREYGLSKVSAEWRDSSEESFYDSDFIFTSMAMLQKWFDPIVQQSPDGWKSKILVSLAGFACTEDAESEAYEVISAHTPAEEPIVLGSPEGPLDESVLLLYPNGENKWVGVLKFGEEGMEVVYVFTVEYKL